MILLSFARQVLLRFLSYELILNNLLVGEYVGIMPGIKRKIINITESKCKNLFFIPKPSFKNMIKNYL
jgi:hypothetical protein